MQFSHRMKYRRRAYTVQGDMAGARVAIGAMAIFLDESIILSPVFGGQE
jgi:hypothetical protein